MFLLNRHSSASYFLQSTVGSTQMNKAWMLHSVGRAVTCDDSRWQKKMLKVLNSEEASSYFLGKMTFKLSRKG